MSMYRIVKQIANELTAKGYAVSVSRTGSGHLALRINGRLVVAPSTPRNESNSERITRRYVRHVLEEIAR